MRYASEPGCFDYGGPPWVRSRESAEPPSGEQTPPDPAVDEVFSELYRTIVADPPWAIDEFPMHEHDRQMGRTGTRSVPYGTLSVEQIKALPVGDLAAPEAHLYLWSTAGFLRESYSVAESWGFEPMYPLVWCKAPRGRGLGGKFTSNVEFVLFCRERHGSLRITSYLADAAAAAGMTAREVNAAMGTSDMAGWWLSRLPHRSRIPTWEQWQQLKTLLKLGDEMDDAVRSVNDHRNEGISVNTRWFMWERGTHSQKPEAFLDLVEQVSHPPRLEMFARRNRLGWDTWGNEAFNHVEMAS